MNRRRTAQSAFLNLRTSIVVLVCALAGYSVLNATLLGFFGPQASLKVSGRTLSFAERVSYQRAIEEVYWRHRIWPENHPDQKPPLDSGMSQAQVEKKVADYLRKSQALQDYWQRPITADGGRYNANTDSWTATSITNVPSPRAYHTAVWTGSEMVVWVELTPLD